MSLDSIVEEIHRQREELFRQFDNDPEAFVHYLQQREEQSGRIVKAPEPPPPNAATQGGRTPRR